LPTTTSWAIKMPGGWGIKKHRQMKPLPLNA